MSFATTKQSINFFYLSTVSNTFSSHYQKRPLSNPTLRKKGPCFCPPCFIFSRVLSFSPTPSFCAGVSLANSLPLAGRKMFRFLYTRSDFSLPASFFFFPSRRTRGASNDCFWWCLSCAVMHDFIVNLWGVYYNELFFLFFFTPLFEWLLSWTLFFSFELAMMLKRLCRWISDYVLNLYNHLENCVMSLTLEV